MKYGFGNGAHSEDLSADWQFPLLLIHIKL